MDTCAILKRALREEDETIKTAKMLQSSLSGRNEIAMSEYLKDKERLKNKLQAIAKVESCSI